MKNHDSTVSIRKKKRI